MSKDINNFERLVYLESYITPSGQKSEPDALAIEKMNSKYLVQFNSKIIEIDNSIVDNLLSEIFNIINHQIEIVELIDDSIGTLKIYYKDCKEYDEIDRCASYDNKIIGFLINEFIDKNIK